jgi:hypothetical protein
MAMLTNKGITLIDYIISCNINQFVHRAMIENTNFAYMKYEQQMQVFRDYADEIIKSNSAESNINDSLKKRVVGDEEE